MGGSINQNVLATLEVDRPLESMLAFGKERQDIYNKKESGQKWPWTKDPTLQHYKFCNIFRDQDKTTQSIVEWVKPLNSLETRVTNLVYARMCNNMDVINRTGYIGSISPEDFIAIIDDIGGGKTKAKVNKNSVWKDPYQISGTFKKRLNLPYREHVIAYHLPKTANALTKVIVNNKGVEDLTQVLEELNTAWGYRMNMVFTQVLLDLSITNPEIVSSEATYPLGDGATPVINLLNNVTLNEIVDAWSKQYPDERQLKPMDAEQLLCEWRKYLVWGNDLAKKRRIYRKPK